MQITIGGMEVSSQEYQSFDDLLDEYVDYETRRERLVPDYDLGVLLTAIGFYLLKKAADELIREARDRRQRGREEEKVRIRDELDEKRHAEMLEKIEELSKALQNAVEARPPEAALTEEAASAFALLQWSKKEKLRIDIGLETDAEVDLQEALEAITKDVPATLVNDVRLQTEEKDST